MPNDSNIIERSSVNHPSHYNAGKIECIDAIEAACEGLDGFEGFCTGNAIKYLFRWKHKGKATEDLQKAEWYQQKLTEYRLSKGEVK